MLFKEFQEKLHNDIEEIVLYGNNDRFKEFWVKYGSDNKKSIEEIISNCAELINDDILSNSDDGCLTANEEDEMDGYIDNCVKKINKSLIVNL